MQDTDALPKLTVTELAIADKVGRFLIPIVKTMVAQRMTHTDDATATFCKEYAATQMALEYMPADASSLARVELELRMRELTSAFVAAHTK